MARRTAAVILTLGCLHAGGASALGLGELTLDSFLNEPFKASVDLLNTQGLNQHQIRIRLATLDDFDRMGVDRAYFLTSITFEVKIDDDGRAQILISSEAPVLEPYLDFIVEARWPSGRLLREYTVLVDPPVFDSTQVVTISARELITDADGDGASDVKKSQAAAASSGTQVKVAKSGLAPGEMPQRNFSSDAAHDPTAGNRYLIRRDDTLWDIALKARPQDTSVHQTMLDIQRLNPSAFIGGNINRIKAGYVIYLPATGDISSTDNAAALAEVRQQNQDWRDGVSSDRGSAGGASLRISTEPAPESAASSVGDNDSATGSATELASLEDLARSERGREEVETRLSAMADQVDTLERIVSLKDDQIAALQSALAQANADNGEADSVGGQAESDASVDLQLDAMAAVADLEGEAAVESDPDVDSKAETTAPATVETPPQPKQAAPTPPREEGGLFDNMLVIAGGLVALAIAAFAFMRRRRSDDDEEEAPAAKDVFADIKLGEQKLDVDAAPPAESTDEAQEPAGNRGYGQRKHDEYADDIDAVDALAEADIYIAYGRFPQARDLLKTAIDSEPNNAAYKLKMMEVCAEMGDQADVMAHYADIKALGDAVALAAADEIAGGLGGVAVQAETPVSDVAADAPDLSDELDIPELEVSGSDINDLDLPDLDLGTGSEEVNLEEDFGSLEIEGFESDDDDLDLSADFDKADAVGDDQELVFAEDSDAMSTKLDLARAYLDMGDQDGARQIFEEVVAEGSDEQKEEARALLERLS